MGSILRTIWGVTHTGIAVQYSVLSLKARVFLDKTGIFNLTFKHDFELILKVSPGTKSLVSLKLKENDIRSYQSLGMCPSL